jgi:hypothetical protein
MRLACVAFIIDIKRGPDGTFDDMCIKMYLLLSRDYFVDIWGSMVIIQLSKSTSGSLGLFDNFNRVNMMR